MYLHDKIIKLDYISNKVEGNKRIADSSCSFLFEYLDYLRKDQNTLALLGSYL
jgi:hypothetical protein